MQNLKSFYSRFSIQKPNLFQNAIQHPPRHFLQGLPTSAASNEKAKKYGASLLLACPSKRNTLFHKLITHFDFPTVPQSFVFFMQCCFYCITSRKASMAASCCLGQPAQVLWDAPKLKFTSTHHLPNAFAWIQRQQRTHIAHKTGCYIFSVVAFKLVGVNIPRSFELIF